jgi:hypothetical protein
MAFPLINPYQQFFDSSGSPLASGTIEFRNPTTNALINSYPTADDADAQTNANDNPLTLNSSGAAASGLYLEDGVKYKVILKDSLGVTVKTDDDVRCPQYTAPETAIIRTIGSGLIDTKLGITGNAPISLLAVPAYTTGAHATLRDFTGTTTAAEALQLLESLVDDLKSKGIIT